MINHCIGNEEDNVKGRQMLSYTYREGRFISVSSPVGPNPKAPSMNAVSLG